jgi:hypothetical protein
MQIDGSGRVYLAQSARRLYSREAWLSCRDGSSRDTAVTAGPVIPVMSGLPKWSLIVYLVLMTCWDHRRHRHYRAGRRFPLERREGQATASIRVATVVRADRRAQTDWGVHERACRAGTGRGGVARGR